MDQHVANRPTGEARDSGRCHSGQHPRVDPVRLRHALRVDPDTVVDVSVEAFAHDPYFRRIALSDD